MIGWFNDELDAAGKERLNIYSGTSVSENNVNRVLARLCYSSVAKTVILPMQDILGLQKNTRMNTPGTNSGNWLWRLQTEDCDFNLIKWLSTETEMYGRSF